MKIIENNNLKILEADKDKHIRLKKDIYVQATETEEEHKPYYATKIYLPINFDILNLDNIYIEEKINYEEIV